MFKKITYVFTFLLINMIGISTLSAQMSKGLVKVEPALPIDNSDGEPQLLPFKERLKLLIEENSTFLDIDTSVEEIATLLRTSPSVVSDIMTSEFGQDYGAYVSTRRVQAAMELLNNIDFKAVDYKDKDAVEIAVRDIAKKCGFKSTGQLYKQFKKNEGMKLEDYLAKLSKKQASVE